MRILQLGKFYPIKGGVEKVMYDLSRGLSSLEGVVCDMLCASLDKKPHSIPLNGASELTALRSFGKLQSTMICPSMLFHLRKIRNDYDIIHVHHPDPMACAALWFSGFKGKVVLHWHSDIFHQNKLLKCYLPFQKWLIRRAEVIVGTTQTYLESSPFLTDVQAKTTCLPIGIDPIQIDGEDAAAIRKKYVGKKIIFSLGRLVPYKGFGYLVRSAAFLPDDYVILIGGEGPMKDELRTEIDASGLQGKVKLLGFLTDREVAALYGACDIYCLSSVFKNEAFGIVQIEAMSAGRPVVATKIPGSGVSTVNESGVSGLNVEPADPEALAAAFMKIMDTPGLHEKLCKGARQRFESLFRKDKMIDKCLSIYNEI